MLRFRYGPPLPRPLSLKVGDGLILVRACCFPVPRRKAPGSPRGTLATFARVSAGLLLTLAWTVPVGVAIGTNRRLAELLQPLEVVASIPATAVFPVLLLGLLRAPGGRNTVSVLLTDFSPHCRSIKYPEIRHCPSC